MILLRIARSGNVPYLYLGLGIHNVDNTLLDIKKLWQPH